MMWNGNWGYGPGGQGWVMLLFMIVFAVAVLVAIVYLVRYLGQPQAAQQQLTPPPAQAPPLAATAVAETPKDILKRRYAAGEIDREEYLQKLGDL